VSDSGVVADSFCALYEKPSLILDCPATVPCGDANGTAPLQGLSPTIDVQSGHTSQFSIIVLGIALATVLGLASVTLLAYYYTQRNKAQESNEVMCDA